MLLSIYRNAFVLANNLGRGHVHDDGDKRMIRHLIEADWGKSSQVSKIRIAWSTTFNGNAALEMAMPVNMMMTKSINRATFKMELMRVAGGARQSAKRAFHRFHNPAPVQQQMRDDGCRKREAEPFVNDDAAKARRSQKLLWREICDQPNLPSWFTVARKSLG
jgi:hypothetical protein